MPKQLFDKDYREMLDELLLAVRRIDTHRRRRKQRGTGQEFADHRDYVPGDDTRYIDWAVYGRLQKLVLRIFESDEPPWVYLLLDCSASMNLGKPLRFDYARRLVAALAYVALAQESHVGVLTVADGEAGELPPVTGRPGITRVFEFLQPLRARGGAPLLQRARELVHSKRRRGLVVIVSDFFETGDFDEAVSLLRYGRFDVLALQLLDADELKPAATRLVRLQSVEQTGHLRMAMTEAARHEYGVVLDEHRRHLGAACVRHGGAFLWTSTQRDLMEMVLALFREGLVQGL